MSHAATATTITGLWTKKDVERDLRMCPRSIDNLMKSRRLAFIRIGRSVRFDPADVKAFKKAYRVESSQ